MISPPAPPLTVSAPAAVSIVVVSVSVKTPPDSSMRTSSAPAPDRTEMSVKAARSKAEVPLGVTTCSDPAASAQRDLVGGAVAGDRQRAGVDAGEHGGLRGMRQRDGGEHGEERDQNSAHRRILRPAGPADHRGDPPTRGEKGERVVARAITC